MPNENTELLDAEQFKNRLMAHVDKDDDEGQKIREYLDNIVPDWEVMTDTRLYKYIQNMLATAEENRRFGIESFTKRVIYIIPLIVILCSAFGYLYYNIFGVTSFVNVGNGNNKISFYTISLAVIAYFNTHLSFHLVKIAEHSQQEEENWEYHINNLQAILGINLPQVYSKVKVEKFSTRRINTSVSFTIFRLSSFMAVLFFAKTIGLSFEPIYTESAFLFSFAINVMPSLLLICGFLYCATYIYEMTVDARFIMGSEEKELRVDMWILCGVALFSILLEIMSIIAVMLQ